MKIDKKIISAILIAAVTTAAIYYLFWYKQNHPTVKQGSITAAVSSNQKKNYIKLLFVGDLMFDRGIRYYANKNGGNEFIFDKISAELLSNDLVVANLEGPITDEKSISAGTIPESADNYVFTFDPSLAKTLYDENIGLVNLGNNHIFNFGYTGLASTEKYLDDADVGYFGAPNDKRSVIKNIKGIRIAFVSYNQFSGDEKNVVIDEIKEDKAKADIIIVFSHWGAEYILTPSDTIKNLAHSFVDAGADLVIGSHPHVIEPMEIYNGKRIYYSLGNFVFDQYFSEYVRNGLGVEVIIDKATKQFEFGEVRFYLQNNGQTIVRQ
jgi:poly-gamma-glutamate capsule biosynthesis protein CapA/YwtB (metallophosphatase superfamily)